MSGLPASLDRCRLCGRIMLLSHLKGDRCRDKWDCCAARMSRWRQEREHQGNDRDP